MRFVIALTTFIGMIATAQANGFCRVTDVAHEGEEPVFIIRGPRPASTLAFPMKDEDNRILYLNADDTIDYLQALHDNKFCSATRAIRRVHKIMGGQTRSH